MDTLPSRSKCSKKALVQSAAARFAAVVSQSPPVPISRDDVNPAELAHSRHVSASSPTVPKHHPVSHQSRLPHQTNNQKVASKVSGEVAGEVASDVAREMAEGPARQQTSQGRARGGGGAGSWEPVRPVSQDGQSAAQLAAKEEEIQRLRKQVEDLKRETLQCRRHASDSNHRASEAEEEAVALKENLALEARILVRRENALKHRESVENKALTDALEAKAELERRLSSHHQRERSLREETQRYKTQFQKALLTSEECEEVRLVQCWLRFHWELALKYNLYPSEASNQVKVWESAGAPPYSFMLEAATRAAHDFRPQVYPKCDSTSSASLSSSGTTPTVSDAIQAERGLAQACQLGLESALLAALEDRWKPGLLSSSSHQVVGEKGAPPPSHGTPGHHNHHHQHHLHHHIPTSGVTSSRSPGALLARDPGNSKILAGGVLPLAEEEVRWVQFRQSWVTHVWTAAYKYGVEADMAEDQAEYWCQALSQHPTSNDLLRVERALAEIRFPGMDRMIWGNRRKFHDEGVAVY